MAVVPTAYPSLYANPYAHDVDLLKRLISSTLPTLVPNPATPTPYLLAVPPPIGDEYVALDCEMVGVAAVSNTSSHPDKPTSRELSALARVSLVDQHGTVLLDTFVKQHVDHVVVNYRTAVSGVRKEDLLDGAMGFDECRDIVSNILKDRILVGHAVANDLSCLHLWHDAAMTRDTQACPLITARYGRNVGLRKLCLAELGIDVQAGEHSSVTDARAAMAVFLLYREGWDAELGLSSTGSSPVSSISSLPPATYTPSKAHASLPPAPPPYSPPRVHEGHPPSVPPAAQYSPPQAFYSGPPPHPTYPPYPPYHHLPNTSTYTPTPSIHSSPPAYFSPPLAPPSSSISYPGHNISYPPPSSHAIPSSEYPFPAPHHPPYPGPNQYMSAAASLPTPAPTPTTSPVSGSSPNMRQCHVCGFFFALDEHALATGMVPPHSHSYPPDASPPPPPPGLYTASHHYGNTTYNHSPPHQQAYYPPHFIPKYPITPYPPPLPSQSYAQPQYGGGWVPPYPASTPYAPGAMYSPPPQAPAQPTLHSSGSASGYTPYPSQLQSLVQSPIRVQDYPPLPSIAPKTTITSSSSTKSEKRRRRKKGGAPVEFPTITSSAAVKVVEAPKKSVATNDANQAPTSTAVIPPINLDVDGVKARISAYREKKAREKAEVDVSTTATVLLSSHATADPLTIGTGNPLPVGSHTIEQRETATSSVLVTARS